MIVFKTIKLRMSGFFYVKKNQKHHQKSILKVVDHKSRFPLLMSRLSGATEAA